MLLHKDMWLEKRDNWTGGGLVSKWGRLLNGQQLEYRCVHFVSPGQEQDTEFAQVGTMAGVWEDWSFVTGLESAKFCGRQGRDKPCLCRKSHSDRCCAVRLLSITLAFASVIFSCAGLCDMILHKSPQSSFCCAHEEGPLCWNSCIGVCWQELHELNSLTSKSQNKGLVWW